MATPSAGKGHGDAHGHHEVHLLSPWPMLIGLGALVLYIGFEFRGIVTALGVLLIGYAFLGWIREDVKLYRQNFVVPGINPGRSTGWWGMTLYLGTEVMLFGGLFAVYFVQRANYPALWAEGREVITHALALVSINTAILLSSGATMHYALHSIRKDNRKGMIAGLILTILLGTTFLVIQGFEYAGFIASGLTISSSPFGSIFYLLTGTHGFHVFLGLVFLGIVLVRGLLGQFTAERHISVDAFAIYWHFVDVVWIFVFLTIYLGVI